MKKIMGFFCNCKADKSMLTVCLLMQFFYALIAIAAPEVLRIGTNAIENKDLSMLKSAAIIAIGSTIIYIFLDASIKIMKKKIANDYEECLQLNLLDKFISIKKIRLKDFKAGDLITNIINNSTDVVEEALNSIFKIFEGSAVIIIGIVYMGIIQWKITILIVLFNIVMRIILLHFEKNLKANAKKSVEITKCNNALIVDILSNMLTIKVFDKGEYFNRKLFEKETDTLKINTKKTAWRNGLQDGMWAAMKLSEYFLLYGYGGFLVYRGETEIGTLIAFTTAIAMYTKGITNFIEGVTDKNVALAVIENIEKILDIPQVENEPKEEINQDKFIITFKNVSFGFSNENILEDINFSIFQNEKIMIKGENGSGKSTLLNLISGLYRPSYGEIMYGSYDISVVNIDELAKKYAYISQNSNIVEGNIYRNLALALKYDREKCNTVLKKLSLEKTIDTPPHALSQGEKQRLNIGRALYKMNEIVIIIGDEIFSNIDKKTEESILESLFEEFEGKTVIMICHEELNLKFDRVFHVKNKNIMINDAGGVFK